MARVDGKPMPVRHESYQITADGFELNCGVKMLLTPCLVILLRYVMCGVIKTMEACG